MATATLVYGPRLERVSQAIQSLESTPTQPATFEGVQYAYAAVGALYTIRDWLAVKAAMEKIEIEAQSASTGNRAAARADYEALARRADALALLLPTAVVRDGIRVRFGVPVP